MDTIGITFTPEKLELFKKELAKYDSDKDTFSFEGHSILVGYGRYLASYLDGVFFTGKKEYLARK